MQYRRILTIQDISCVGQCSMTVALPILSACGLETCILPTALLSTHPGGFGKPEVVHFDDHLNAITRHWQENQITFDAILVGYLGSIGAVAAASRIIDTMLAPGGLAIVDPAMADHGRLYSGLNEAYAWQMGQLCRRADILLPNLTEAAMLAGMPWQNCDSGSYVSESYVNEILSALAMPRVVLTGVGFREGQTGAAVWEAGRLTHCPHPKLGGSFHGTGDIFAAAFTGALMRGKTIGKSGEIAGDFTCRCIARTLEQPAHWYGVKFEPVLPELIEMLK